MEEPEVSAFPSKYRMSAVIVFIGAGAVLGLVILGFLAPEEALSLDRPQEIAQLYAAIRSHQQVALLGIVLDTVFITGYISLFCGLWMVIRDFSDILATTSLTLGLLVGLGDIIENAILFTLIVGIPEGWNPEPVIFNLVWTINQLIDISSYIAAIFFGVQFVMIFPHQRLKLGIGILFLLYAVVGFLAILYPTLFLVRSAVFVIGLGSGAIMLFNEQELSDEELLQLLSRSKESTDYIR